MENLNHLQKELYDWLVEYIDAKRHSPSIRQMMEAMDLRSPSPIQNRLRQLRELGYIDWTEGKARTIRILRRKSEDMPILGAIAAGGLVEPFTEVRETLDLAHKFQQQNCFALQVVGDSMIEDYITEGDLVIMRPPSANEQIKTGKIIAARIEGYGTTLKHFYCHGELVTLKAANPKYPPIEVQVNKLEIQGILMGIWRSYC